jgi:large subunit ribosomal protein L17
MKKRNKRKKLNKRKVHSDAILRDLLYALLRHGKVETVTSRAKTLSSYADKQISHALGWGGETALNRYQQLTGNKRSAALLNKYVEFMLNENSDKSTGVTKVIKTRFRKGDNAPMAEVLLYDWENFNDKYDVEKDEAARTRSKKKSRKVSNKAKKKGVKPDAAEKDDKGIVSKLGGRLLGRKQGKQKAADTKQTRSRARSGL